MSDAIEVAPKPFERLLDTSETEEEPIGAVRLAEKKKNERKSG